MPPEEQAATLAVSPIPDLAPRQLWPEDVVRLTLDDHPRIATPEAVSILRRSPGSSFWIPETSEFIIVTPWRHRAELVTVHTFGAFANEHALLTTAIEHARTEGRAGFVLVDVSELRHPSFYERHGLATFGEIVTYEHRRPAQANLGRLPADLTFRQVTARDAGLLDEVLALDHISFPWFWWNSAEEFIAYLDYPGVEIWAGIREHELVSYAGTTQYRRWSHLDRIATRPDLQGSGVGRATLAFALERMVRRGGRRVALSTQGDNTRSRMLYERSGFSRTPYDDYSVFVAPFNETLVYAAPGTHHQPPVTGK